jgi:hypothetical protein
MVNPGERTYTSQEKQGERKMFRISEKRGWYCKWRYGKLNKIQSKIPKYRAAFIFLDREIR